MTNTELADYLNAALRQMQTDCRLKQGGLRFLWASAVTVP